MEKDKKTVSHKGVVQKVNEDHVEIKIISESACAKCHVKSFCSASDMSEKIVEAITKEVLEKGDKVEIVMEEKLGWIAVFFTFLFPFLILISTLIGILTITKDELIAGISSFLILVPYYLVLYFLRDRFKKNFVFTAEKIDDQIGEQKKYEQIKKYE